MMNIELQAQLLILKQRDLETRARLVASGTLYQGYNRGVVQPISYAERQNEIVEWARIVG